MTNPTLDVILSSNVPYSDVAELIKGLPPPATRELYIDRFFAHFNWARCPIPERPFRARYADFDHTAHLPFPFARLTFAGLLYIVLALGSIAVISQPPAPPSTETSHLFWLAEKAMAMCRTVGTTDLDLVWAHGLICRYLSFHRRGREVWFALGNYIRLALDMGLHRDGTEFGLDPGEVAERRVLWLHIIHTDRSWSVGEGRPVTIHDEIVTTEMPSAAQISQTDVGLATFLQFRNNFVPIMSDIITHFQRRFSNAYAHVRALDNRIGAFLESLPACLAAHDEGRLDRELDRAMPRLPFYRHLVVSEVLYNRILLHRPYFLQLGEDKTQRKLQGTEDEFVHSRRICIEAARMDLRTRKQSMRELSKPERGQAWGGGGAHFNSAVVIALALLSGEQEGVADMINHLVQYVKDLSQAAVTDHTTQRERRILELLLAKLPVDLTTDAAALASSPEGAFTSPAVYPVYSSPVYGQSPLIAPRSRCVADKSRPLQPTTFHRSRTGRSRSGPRAYRSS